MKASGSGHWVSGIVTFDMPELGHYYHEGYYSNFR